MTKAAPHQGSHLVGMGSRIWNLWLPSERDPQVITEVISLPTN